MPKFSVLIVDDEDGMRLGAARSLEKFSVNLPDFCESVDFELRCAATGAEAREMLNASMPDILLLDYKLPDTTGIDIIDGIGAAHDIAIVMMTAFASLDVAVAATRRGAFDFLAKPFTPEELRSSVQKATKHLYLRRKAQRLEMEKRRVRFEFISVLAHELKSPIAAVEGYLQIMSAGLKGDALKSYSFMIERSIMRLDGMRKLVMDMLDLTRIESGEKKRILEQIDLPSVVAAALDGVRPAASERNIKIVCSAEPDDINFTADKSEMDIIFNNLLSNAVKYNKDGGSVSLTVHKTDEGISIACSDTGIGMTQEEQARLFGEFARIKNERTKDISGSGLGLSILKKISALYSGDIQVDSRKDEGTTFTVALKNNNP